MGAGLCRRRAWRPVGQGDTPAWPGFEDTTRYERLDSVPHGDPCDAGGSGERGERRKALEPFPSGLDHKAVEVRQGSYGCA